MHERLFELRKAKNITQQKLAVDLDIEQASISNYESGNYYPTVEVLIKLAQYFGVSTDYLLGLSDVKTCLKTAMDDQTSYYLSLFSALPASYRAKAIGYLERLYEEQATSGNKG